ncbi:MAG: 3-oxoacyl-ACP synthase [Flavobacteriales bacterium]|nr:3-oxoacyl-ACP synthase [Flavobacteriales bacterium]MBO72981.1 3-oxoacyl-ACP synthase [Flavobacteriales bacterium]|tara:strand:+ start:1512 stop:2468 length:957 start_codon:yes stop_codon:yes gene_type:complete
MLNIEIAFPEKILSNEELQNLNPEYNLKRLEKKLGIKERRVVEEGQTSLDLALKACNQLFEKYDKHQIDYVIYCTQSPEYFLPTTACILQSKLELGLNVGAFDYNLGCSGYIYGLSMAKSFIQSGLASNVLLVTAESYSKFLHKEDITNRAIFGDAATATVIGYELAKKIGEFNLGSDGSGAENLIFKEGGGRSNFSITGLKEQMFHMNGSAVFQFTLDNVPNSVHDCLNKNNLKLEDVDYFILHQANKYMLGNLRRKLGVDEDKFYIDVEYVGNTVSSTIPIALSQSVKRGLIKKGDCVLLCGFGVGYSWGSTVIKF